MSTHSPPAEAVMFSVPVSRTMLDDDREYAADQVAYLAREAVLGWTPPTPRENAPDSRDAT